MDQINPPSPLQKPLQATQASPKPVVQELPHLVVDEPKRSKAGIFGIVVLSIMLLGLPIGIFLVNQRTQLAPQAAVTQVAPEVVTGIFMESKLSQSGNQEIPVEIYIKSPVDNFNLVGAQIRFDPSLISMERISTGSAELNQQTPFNKWMEVSFDNEKGTAAIISGLPNPGVKTGSSADDKAYLATIYLKPKKAGTAILQMSPQSQIFRNSDNINIFKTGNDLALNLSNVPAEGTPSASPKKNNGTGNGSVIVLTNPAGALNYSYFKPMEVIWSSFNVERISQINLYVNDEKLGAIAQNLIAAEGKFVWQPKDTLALHYIQPANTYSIEIIGVSKNGDVARMISGPFGLSGTEETTGSVPSQESFSQNQLSVTDVSRALTNYLAEPIRDNSLDLNKDGIINALDFYLMRLNLLERGVIK